MTFHIITGEYPPDRGGVADYSELVATGLAEAGHVVHVWTRRPNSKSTDVTVHSLPGGFGFRGLHELDTKLDAFPGPRTLVIQYVPHAYGFKAMNIAFVAWVLQRRIRCCDDVRVLFHEVAFPWVRHPWKHNIIASVTRLMAAILVQASRQIYVATPAWTDILRTLGGRRVPIRWTPVPANVTCSASPEQVAARKRTLLGNDGSVRLLGHLGTYGTHVVALLAPLLQTVLTRQADVRVILMGSGGDQWRELFLHSNSDWTDRVIAPGPLTNDSLAEYLKSCDLMVQPFPDGATTRRTSLMAALANGVPVVTTAGELTEAIWFEESVALAPATDADQLARLVLHLLNRPEDRASLGHAGKELYDRRFALSRTIEALLQETAA